MPQIAQLADVFASQLFWLVVVFGIIFFGIGRGMLPKIRSTALAREKRIADDLEKAKAAQEQATKTEEEWRARMDAARVETARVAQKARQESAREFDARLGAALEDIDAKVEAARQRIWTSVQSARAELEETVIESARQIVEDLTGVQVSKKDAARVVAADFQLMTTTGQRKQPVRMQKETKRAASGAR